MGFMKKVMLKSDYPCVYSLNGTLCEDGWAQMEENSVYYVTVLPLDAVFLPYTVKIIGDKVVSNKDLCINVRLKNKSFLIFTKRYNYMYLPTSYVEDECLVTKLFYATKQGNCEKARQYLTPSLSSTVADENLRAFFDKYEFIMKTDENKWLLADGDGNGEIFCTTLKDNLIDDMYTEN